MSDISVNKTISFLMESCHSGWAKKGKAKNYKFKVDLDTQGSFYNCSTLVEM